MKRTVIAAVILSLGTVFAAAQNWPTKLVKIIVPFAAGATLDVVARLIADDLQTRLNQAFIVENRPGASGNTGTDAVAKAEPDGGTIGVSIGGPLAINTLLFPKLPYDPRKDLTLITLLVTQPSVLAVNASLGVNDTRAEFGRRAGYRRHELRGELVANNRRSDVLGHELTDPRCHRFG